MLTHTSVRRYNCGKERGDFMLINDQIQKKKITKYRLSKDSGVPQATINDICSGKTDLEKCAAGTLYRIAKTLEITVEDILESAKKD